MPQRIPGEQKCSYPTRVNWTQPKSQVGLHPLYCNYIIVVSELRAVKTLAVFPPLSCLTPRCALGGFAFCLACTFLTAPFAAPGNIYLCKHTHRMQGLHREIYPVVVGRATSHQRPMNELKSQTAECL